MSHIIWVILYGSYRVTHMELPRISLSDMSKRFSTMVISGPHFNHGFGSGFQNSRRLWMSKTEKMYETYFPISLERKSELSTTWMSKSKLFLEPSTLDLRKTIYFQKHNFSLSTNQERERKRNLAIYRYEIYQAYLVFNMASVQNIILSSIRTK